MSDRVVLCRDCGQEFTFTAGEQAFYQERGFSEPTRCKPCRDKRKTERNAGGYDSYGSGGGGGGSYGGGGGSYGSSGGGAGAGRSYNSGPREMHAAVCTSCGKETEVPFEPTAGKPVYCQDCFRENRRSSSSYGSRY